MKYLFLLILCVCTKICFSQNHYSLPTINGKPLSLFIDESFRKSYYKNLDTIGVHGFCWVKFKVSPNGLLKDLEVSPNTPPAFSSFLKSTIEATSGFWTFKEVSEWFVLPFRFTLQKNGDSKNNLVDADQLEIFLIGNESKKERHSFIFLELQELNSPFDRVINPKMKLVNAN